MGAMLSFSPEYAVPPPPPPPPPACDEIGRVTRACVSAYNRARVHVARGVRGERRCLVADLNGALSPGRTIVSAVWRTNDNTTAILANAGIASDGRSTLVNLTLGWGGESIVKAEVTLDNGEVYNQLFRVDVRGAPYFEGETFPAAGPTSLSVSA